MLLYSVFHIGGAANNVAWRSVETIERQSDAAWVIPPALGESHHGFPVPGTDGRYSRHFRYSSQLPLALRTGTSFRAKPFQAVFEKRRSARTIWRAPVL